MMRILLANDGFGDAGGVQNYLDALAGGLAARGHQLAILHRDGAPGACAGDATRSLPQFSTSTEGLSAALNRVSRWAPDVCFSHNMDALDIDRGLMARWPVVKFMHGYSGTCISGQKRFGFPTARPCGRRFGAACLALYGPRHCGELNAGTFVRQYRWAQEQHALLADYSAIVVASDHMRDEFVRNGVPQSRVHVHQLFATHAERPPDCLTPPASDVDSVAFVGRMTALKGGDLLVDAVAEASAMLGRSIRLLLIGDGPQRPIWERRAADRNVSCTASGWLTGHDRWTWLSKADVLAVPSTWPEPFGLVGLEAAALGIPAIAFDVGGIREWLRPGLNGCVVPANPPRATTFAAALAAMLSDRDRLRAMRAAAVVVAREMSLERHLDRLEPLLMQHAGAHAHPVGR
jgi:glycosyltransferase involved in cell wall biosynthesis